jgi:hypothetical protein
LSAEKNARDDEIIRLATLKAIAQGSTDERSNSATGGGAEAMIGLPALDLMRLEARREVEACGGYT